MGRRALQRGAKSLPPTPPPAPEPPPPPPPCDVQQYNIQPTPTSSKGLDRVLLERNLERLLSEHGSGTNISSEVQAASPELERLLQARDRSREPLNLAELSLSLDSWEPPEHTSSMPELALRQVTPPPPPPPPPQPTTPTSPSRYTKPYIPLFSLLVTYVCLYDTMLFNLISYYCACTSQLE